MEPSLQPPQDYCIITAILLECQTSPTTLLIGAHTCFYGQIYITHYCTVEGAAAKMVGAVDSGSRGPGLIPPGGIVLCC